MKRLRIGEQLEVRAAPGSMMADVMALGGHSAAMAPRGNESTQEPQQQPATDGGIGSPNGAARVAHPQTSQDENEQPEPGAEFGRAETQARGSESEHRQVPARDPSVANRQTKGDAHREQRSSGSAADALFSDASILVGTGLDDGLDAPESENHHRSMDGETGERPMPGTSDSGTSAGQLPDLPEGSNIAAGNRTRDIGLSSHDSYSGYSDLGPSAGSGQQVNLADLAASLAPSLSSANPTLPAASPTVPPVSPHQDESSSSPGSSVLAGTRPRQTDNLGFTNGFAGWNIQELGGSAQGKGTVTAGSANLCEGDSFLVLMDQDLIIPQGPLSLSFTYKATFDTTDPDSINDAFEAVLTAADGSPLVYSFAPERDAYFNLTGTQRCQEPFSRRIPPEAIQIRDLLVRVLVGIDQRRDDIDRSRATTALDNVVADLAERERLGDLRVRLLVHPLGALRPRSSNEVIVFAQTLAAAKVRVS